MEVVRARKLGSVFERRLESQESPKYRNLIRQHIDLGTIQTRLEEGQYADCHTKFYRDLMLLTTNAFIFFPTKSSERKAALELRHLFTKHFQSHLHPHKSQAPKPKPNPPSSQPGPSELKPDPAHIAANLKPKLAITVPVIACRKRSSIAGKPSASSGGERKEQPTSEKPEVAKTSSSSFNAVTKKRTRDQSFGSRSSSSKNTTTTNNNNKNTRPSPSAGPSPSPKPSPSIASIASKGDKKKPSPGDPSSKTKRGSGSGDGSLLLDLLKSSATQKNGGKNEGSSNNNVKSERPRKDQGSRNNSLGSKVGKEKGKEERENMASRNIGRPPKRAAAIAAMGKRGREGGGGGDAEALPKKRQRK